MISVLSLICVAGCASGLLLIATLLMQKPHTSADKLLVCSILLTAANVLFVAIKPVLPTHSLFFEVLRASSCYGLVFAPLLYLYFCVQLTGTVLTKSKLWHLGWFACCQAIVMFEVTFPTSLPWLTINSFENAGTLLILAGYFIANVRVLRETRRHDSYLVSSGSGKVTYITLLVMHACYAITVIANLAFSQNAATTLTTLNAGMLSVLLMILAFSYPHQALATPPSIVTEPVPSPPSLDREKEKYGNNRLPEFLRDTIVDTLAHHMQCEQPWLDIDLTLSRLAESINVNPHHLSQIINSEFGKSFACYINEYRVNAACKLLSADDNRTVLEIASQSGFSSKSSFNTIFKKHTGLTPSEYRKKYQLTANKYSTDDNVLASNH